MKKVEGQGGVRERRLRGPASRTSLEASSARVVGVRAPRDEKVIEGRDHPRASSGERRQTGVFHRWYGEA
jgi:hypothetical protein